MSTQNQQYPIGSFVKPAEISPAIFKDWIATISALPEDLSHTIKGFSEQQLDTPYREGGWTVRQLVHHLADSHMNAYCRFKLALTEDKPIIKPYFEDRWAQLPDAALPVNPSLAILEGLHQRWTSCLSSLRDEQLSMIFIHPDHGREISIKEATGMYAWHSKHHLAHILTLKKVKGWI